MTRHALIVEDDPLSVRQISDTLVSLGYTFDTVSSQVEAMKWIEAKDYSLILLDIQIMVHAQSCEARVQNTENLLDQIIESGKAVPPVILLSDYSVEGVKQTAEVMRWAMSLARKGAMDVIAKPFPKAGRTLDRVINKVLKLHSKALKDGQPIHLPTPPLPVNKKTPVGQYVATAADTDDDGTDDDDWITVTQAAKLLANDVPRFDMAKARSRVSAAAGREEFVSDGSRKERRIERVSFGNWLLKQRNRDLDAEDDDE